MEELHAVQWGQRGEQAGVKAHRQEIPQSTLIKSLGTCTHTHIQHGESGLSTLVHRTVGINGSQSHTRVSLEFMMRSNALVAILETFGAYLMLEQPVNVFSSKRLNKQDGWPG